MNTAKTVTHLLFPLFIGLIIGGIIVGSTASVVWGILLLIADIVVGVCLQNALENAAMRRRWQSLSDEEKRALVRAFVEENFPDIDDDR
ncbi:MAG: hypothetical protein IKC75_01965 [Clostridia bacterium]|nr:hypothetical protein [Clostridia bacterium]